VITICGRYYLKISIDKLLEKYGIINDNIEYTPSSEIFPSQNAPIILNESGRNIYLCKWGFSPSYAKKLIINARAETLDKKKTFKKPLQKKRCIIPASGFFEWEKRADRKIKCKIYLKDQEVFSLAGLYDNFINKSGESINAFTIITTKANDKIGEIHDRMPAILSDNNISDWLDPMFNNVNDLNALLKPYTGDDLILEPEIENTQMHLDF